MAIVDKIVCGIGHRISARDMVLRECYTNTTVFGINKRTNWLVVNIEKALVKLCLLSDGAEVVFDLASLRNYVEAKHQCFKKDIFALFNKTGN